MNKGLNLAKIILFRPKEAFGREENQTAYGKPLLFGLGAISISAFLHVFRIELIHLMTSPLYNFETINSAAFLIIISTLPIDSLLNAFVTDLATATIFIGVSASILQAPLYLMGRNNYGKTVSIFGLSSIIFVVFSLIEFLKLPAIRLGMPITIFHVGLLKIGVILWGIFIFFQGFRTVFGLSKVKAALSLIVPSILLFLLFALLPLILKTLLPESIAEKILDYLIDYIT